MKDIMPLLKIIEMTRNQPMYGYQFSVRSKGEVSDLAQHHYLVTFIAWQLALAAERAGAKLNVRTVLELALVHDLGELFGGDINFHYARAFPKARAAAKGMQQEARKFLVSIAGQGKSYLRTIMEEGEAKLSDEAIIARVADHAECQFYRTYMRLAGGKVAFSNAMKIMRNNAEKAHNIKTRKVLIEFSKRCAQTLQKEDLEDMIAKQAKVID